MEELTKNSFPYLITTVQLLRGSTMKTIYREEGYSLALRETYLAMIEGSTGSAQYRKLFVKRDDGPYDVIGNGDLACAFFVSSILYLLMLTRGGVHTTVDETLKDMLRSGWREVHGPEPGAVVVWGLKLSDTDGLKHRHIGFCLDGNRAVSTSAKRRSPILHLINGLTTEDGSERPVQAYYTHFILSGK